IDGIFVGRGVGPDGIAAVNIIAPLFMITTGIALMFGIGSSVSAGIAIASKDGARANRIVSSAFLFSSVLIAVIVAVCFMFSDGVARLLGCSDLLMDKATDYLLYLLIGLLPLMWQSIGMMVIRLDGSPKYAMMCNVIPALLNIVLDWWFVFPLGMGVKGAALATSIACITGGLMAVSYFGFSYHLKLTTRLSGFWRMVRNQMVIGSSAFITEIAMSVMMFTGNIVFMRSWGENGVAAYSIACYLFPLIFMISNAVAQSAQPIISVNYGAGQSRRVTQALRVSLSVAAVCGIISTVGIGFGARLIVGLFIPVSSQAGVLAVDGLPIYAVAATLFALNIAFIGYYQSVEKSFVALMLTLMRGIIFLVPLFFVLPAVFPTWGMWGAIPASELLTLTVTLITFRHFSSDFNHKTLPTL
ncbi:MAG: polysaccharide biosynthesis C-terminal domain-containing protein, partial [Muribaculaceae bacterium]|nr:polysaccharide biosynthesis C-terminal domain-containing protein [Muribaculaceae bacterium]